MRPDAENLFRKNRRRMLRGSCALAALIAALGAISAEAAPALSSRRDLGISEERASGVQAAVRDLLQSHIDDSLLSTSESLRQQLIAFYASRQFRPVWSGGTLENERAEDAIAALARADDQGLRSEDYLSAAIQSSVRLRRGSDAARYDIVLTDAVLRYARDVSIGRVQPNDVYKDVKLPAPDFDAVGVLTRLSSGRSIAASLNDLAPPHAEYRRLAQAMERYRAIAAKGGWPSLPARGEISLEGGDRRLKALIERLAAEDPELAAIPEPNSDAVQAAVRRFQSRNGLEADGHVNTATLTGLNVPVARRIEVIAANMERWRWLPRTLENRYIAVNVPDQSAAFITNGDVVLSSRVVVGRKTSPTPILRAAVVALIANPPWEIPGDIVVNQLLPKLRRSSGYLQASNMVLMNAPNDPFGRKVNWRNVSPSTFPYRVVQIPGPHNALGNLMLDTPNDFDVYLHDTPGKALFKSADRAVSNGCIRVEAIHELGGLALGGDDPDGKIARAIAAHETLRIPLDAPLPVYFLYWTAIAGPDGAVGFRGDLYGRDARLIKALAAPPSERRDAPSAADANATDTVSQPTRVNDTLLPADIDPGADSDRGQEIPPLDERGSELPPVDDQGAQTTPLPGTDSATRNDGVAEAVRRANVRTRFTDTHGRSVEGARPSEPTGLRRSWPSDDARYRRNNRSIDQDGPFPLLRRLFEGNRQSDRYTRR